METLFRERNMKDKLDINQSHLVVILHRPSNVDDETILSLILAQLNSLADTYTLIWPIHPRPEARIEDFNLESYIEHENIRCVPPLGYVEFMSLVSSSNGVSTNSG